MSFLALSLVLVAALLHATWNVAAKSTGGASNFSFQTAVAVVILWAPPNILLVFAKPESSPVEWSGLIWLFIAGSAFVHAAYVTLLLQGYRLAPLSIVYPVARGTGPLLSSFAAIIFLNENFTLHTAGGVLGVIAGVLLLTWGGSSSTLAATEIRAGILWGGATGFTIALYTILDGYAVKKLGVHPLHLDYVTNLLRVPLLLPFIVRSELFKISRPQWKAILAVGVLGPAAYVLVLFAMQIAPLSHVAPARELSLLMGVFLSGKFLEEENMKQRMLAALCIAVGVVLLTAG